MSHPSTTSGIGSTVVINQEYFRNKCGQKLVEESPHLKHASVGDLCGRLATEALRTACPGTGPAAILDMGAGEGMLTLPYLDLGAQVVAADASDELLEGLRSKAGTHQGALAIMPGDIFATLKELTDAKRQFDVVCASSFLHHIPDCAELCRCTARLVRPGGLFFTFQDPLRYDTLGRMTYFLDRASYFWWRLFQGNYLRGLKTRLRRLSGRFRDDLPEDTAEYHVVRNGVDQEALKQLLEGAGFDCSLRVYWSTQPTFFQWLGERLKLANTFGIMARRRP